MKTASTTFLPVLATMLLSVCITLSARADRAENAFVVVEGDGVVRLDGKNFAVLSSGKGESLVKVTAQPGWKLDTPSSAKVSAAKPLRYKATDASHEGSGTGQISGLTATFITPAGDPVNAPVDSGEGQNEFTFSTASTGTLTIGLKVKIDPVLSDDQAPVGDFSIEGIGNSANQWAAANPNGRASYSGGYYTATVTFSGLPANNSAFGKKTVTFSVADVTITQVFEVFFPKNGTNHPSCTSCANCPNWFFYWRQTLGSYGDLIYKGGHTLYRAETPGILKWSYTTSPDKTHVYVYDKAALAGSSYWTGHSYSGIDRFHATIVHERVHLSQIARFDALVPSSGTDSFRFGWSWNTHINGTPHNHWNKGNDGQWGVAYFDDDRNMRVDDAAPIPPFEPGNGDDVELSSTAEPNWPTSIALPIPNGDQSAVESEAVNYSNSQVTEHQNATKDWGNPGKQHKTINFYND